MMTTSFNPIPGDKIVDSSKLKEFAETISNLMEMAKSSQKG